MGGVESRGDVVAVAMYCAEGVGESAEVEPVAEEMFQHRHAGGTAVLKHDDGDAGGRHPGDEPFKVREPLLSRNVIEGVGTEDEIALGLRTGGYNRRADGVGLRDSTLELGQQIGVRFDRNGAVEGPGEGAGDFPVAGASVDEDLSRGQVVHQPL